MIDKIGNRLVASLKPKDKPYQIHDSELGRFFVRVQPSGVVTYGCNLTLPDGRRTTYTIGRHGALTPTQARDEAKRLLADVLRRVDPIAAKEEAKRERSRNPTLAAFIEIEYGPWALTHQKRGAATIQMLTSSFPDLLPLRLGDITSWSFEKWRTNALKAGAKASSVNRKLDALKAMLAKAVEWERLKAHPLAKVKRKKVDDPSRIRYLTADEETQLRTALIQREVDLRNKRRTANLWRAARSYQLMPDLEAVAFPDHLRPMILLSLNLGVRRGELFGLRMENVNLEQRVVTIVGDNAKSGKTRHIPLNNEAYETLTSWISDNGIRSGLIFPGESGEQMDNVNKAWRGVRETAGLDDFRWHDMRHHFASALVMRGVDLNTVRELLGHGDIKMTLRYAHLSPRVKAEAVAMLDLRQSKVSTTEKSQSA